MSSFKYRLPHAVSAKPRAFVTVLGLAAACSVACGVETSPDTEPEKVRLASSDGPYAIHVYVGTEGHQKRYDFGPIAELSGVTATGEKPAATALKATAGSIKPLDDEHPPGEELPSEATIDEPGKAPWSTAWAMLFGAALECDFAATTAPPWQEWYFPYVGPFPHPPNYVPMHRQRWFIGGWHLGKSAVDRIQLEDSLLCVADKLAEVADAVGPVVWKHEKALKFLDPKAPYSYGTPPSTKDEHASDDLFAPWTVPPQADKDRFIVRDLAIHVLAHIPYLDAMKIEQGPSAGATPAQVLANVAESGLLGDENGELLRAAFDVPLARDTFTTGAPWVATYPSYPPSKVPIMEQQLDASGNLLRPVLPSEDHSREIARSALAIEGQILRGAGRLLHDLIRRSVYSDMAGAEQRGARAMDPDRANRIAWGAEGPYNSFAHAVRVLGGRWEIAAPHADPQCGGVKALDLFADAYGPDRDARAADAPIQTKGEAAASRAVEKSGVVIPTCALESAQDASLRSAIVDQLIADTSAANGATVSPSSGLGLAIARSIEELDIADIRFALARTYRTYRMLTNLPPQQPEGDLSCPALSAGVAGLAPPAVVVPSVTSLRGTAVAGGMGRSRIPTDVMAHAAAMLEASECNSETAAWTPWGTTDRTDFMAPAVETDAVGRIIKSSWPLPPAVFQGAFHIGQALERRLTHLRTLSRSPTIKDGREGDPEASARAGMAELRSWAGTAMFVATAAAPSDAAPSSFHVTVTGYDVGELGVAPAMEADQRNAALRDSLAFVYGPPWVAECAARLRHDCPESFESEYVVKPSAVEASFDVDNLALASGALGPKIDFTVEVPTGNAVPRFRPQLRGAETGPDHLYVVRTRGLSDVGGRGSVLGTLALRRTQRDGMNEPISTTFVVSPMQQELFNVVLGIGKWVGQRPPRLGDASAAKSAGYCVDGVKRDTFVPLENELTSDSDQYENSWRHYLGLAKEASARADLLAKDLIDLNLRRDERMEAAGEAVGEICGDLGALARATPDERGVIVPGKDDKTLQVCLAEERKDVVFLADVPPKLIELRKQYPAGSSEGNKAASDWVKENVLLCKGRGGSSDLCDPNRVLTFDALSLVKQPTPKKAKDLCPNTLRAIGSLRTGLDGAATNRAFAEPTSSDQNLKFAAQNLKMNVGLNGEWSVLYAGAPIMSTTSTTLWPGCMRSGGLAGCSDHAKQYDALFRWCDGARLDEKGAFVDPAPFGSCDPPTGADGVAAELNTLRWHVEGTLWFLGAFTGNVPPGMFTTPIPVFTEDATEAHRPIPLPAAYYGKVEADPTAGPMPVGATKAFRMDANPADYQDRQPTPSAIATFGTVYDVPSSFGAYGLGALLGEIPPWYYDMYRNDGVLRKYLRHRYVSNNDEPSDFRRMGGPGTKEGDALPLTKLQGFIPKMTGLSCARPVGNDDAIGRVTDYGGMTLELAIASAKMSSSKHYGYQHISEPDHFFQVVGFGGPRFECWQGSFCDHPGTDPRWPGPTTPWWRSEMAYDRLDAYQRSTFNGFTKTEDAWMRAARPADMPSPGNRARAFVNSGAPNGDCGAAATMLDALGLACVSTSTRLDGLNGAAPPVVNDLSQVASLEAWLALASDATKLQLARLYVEKVPVRVIEDFREKRVGTGSKKGLHGQEFLRMETALASLPGQWGTISRNLLEVADAIRDARIALAVADLARDATLRALALDQIRLQSKMAQELISGGLSIASSVIRLVASEGMDAGAYVNIASTATSTMSNMDTSLKEMDDLQARTNDEEKKSALNLSGTLSTLNQKTGQAWTSAERALGDIRGTVATILGAGESIDLLQQKAQYQVAKGGGEDFFVTLAGEAVPIPVNTVLRRQSSATEIRYRRALSDAKALAYMARRAIEQRIGVPLEAITTRVGSLDPPALWADDVCRASGVDYAKLRKALPPDAGAAKDVLDSEAISEFADAFIGDYVAKLESFVEFYNADFPSHEADDMAVLSLKDDLIPPSAMCVADAPNLLFQSGNLDALASPSEDGEEAHAWQSHPCEGTKCLVAASGVTLASPRTAPSVEPAAATDPLRDGRSVTWLSDLADPSPPPRASTWPAGLVSQAVRLDVGKYVLSWWDQARTADGRLAASNTPLPPYRVEVQDPSWGILHSFQETPFVAPTGASGPDLWSARRTLAIVVTAPGVYRIAFGASARGDRRLGSVAIAQVQLEKAPADGKPTAYVETTANRRVTSLACPRSPASLRSLFERRCDADQTCYYELLPDVTINTEDLRDGVSRLEGKLARGNHNFRHVNVALNLVGTGVRDCTDDPTSGCFGTGYTEYGLQHDATTAGILDWNGDTRMFDFGVAHILRGKALAAERVITMPVSSVDQALLGQPGIEKPELRGRPLDGNYRLQIMDSPSLKWDRLEDVQLVLRYRYWSRIDKSSGH
jgi:hypothetical protein